MNSYIDEEIPRMEADVEVGLYRIAQEALNNALKHAKGYKIDIELKQKNEEIQLTIKDSGPGFSMDSGTLQKGGNGMANMAQRANSINSEIKIQSAIGIGTEICVKYRLNE